MDQYTMDQTKDPLVRGEFPVILDLVAQLKGGAEAKNECDKVIDRNGPAKTGGAGVKQLRENIAESKLSYEIMDDNAQAFLKSKIMDSIHKYFYLIAFTAYMRHSSDNGKLDGFCSWMESHSHLRRMIAQGKGDLQWERAIPAESLASLEKLGQEDFHANTGQIIRDIYQIAHRMFSDMPEGDHKKRAKYRFASKTLMRILPSPLKEEMEALVKMKVISMDLYEILGKCSLSQDDEVECGAEECWEGGREEGRERGEEPAIPI